MRLDQMEFHSCSTGMKRNPTINIVYFPVSFNKKNYKKKVKNLISMNKISNSHSAQKIKKLDRTHYEGLSKSFTFEFVELKLKL